MECWLVCYVITCTVALHVFATNSSIISGLHENLILLVLFKVLTVDEIISSKAVAVTFGKKVLGPMAFLIPLIVCLSTMGNQNGILLVTARLSFAAGRSGLMPRVSCLEIVW